MSLSPEAATFVEFNRRFGLVLRLMNVNDLERLIAAALIQDSAPWPFKTLADYVCAPRSTVRNAMLDLCAMDLCETCCEGAALNARGRALFTDAISETYRLATGHQPGLSEGLMARFRALPTDGVRRPFSVPGELRALRFPPLSLRGVSP